MILVGDNFFMQNANTGYDMCEKMINIGNRFQKVNMNFIMSTPTRYVQALKRENTAWPVKNGNFLNQHEKKYITQGAFSSRPSFKKHIRDASAQYYALAKAFSRQVIDSKVSKDQAEKYVKTSEDLLDQISVMQSSAIIPGDVK